MVKFITQRTKPRPDQPRKHIDSRFFADPDPAGQVATERILQQLFWCPQSPSGPAQLVSMVTGSGRSGDSSAP